MIAVGNVTLANGTEAAEAQKATYEVAAGTIEMEGDVLLTQGQNALSSQKLHDRPQQGDRPARRPGEDDLRARGTRALPPAMHA